MRKIFKVLIVGCGNIAGDYDMGRDKVEFTCSHAGTYSRNEGFKMVACVEPDESKRHSFMDYWSISRGFSSLEEVLNSNLSIDIISICSPTKFHFNNVMLAIKLAPKLIFCEKPVTATSKETKLIIDACDKNGILLAVNYTRRWDPEIEKLKQQLDSRHYGELHSVIGCYNKGILNNGSHMIDLLHYLLGKLRLVDTMRRIIDYFDDDPTISALLQSEQGVPIYLAISNAKDYALFELQLICSKGMLIMHDGGLYWNFRQVMENEKFIGYQKLDAGNRYIGGYQRAMMRAMENIYEVLTKKTEIASDGSNAYQAQLVCEQIVEKGKYLEGLKLGR
ncbi:MAG: Gfo/Idh/MocA family oxidoreductase [Coxiellaceae bacterium]|jgi:predicted dehydrogenase|nr:Gfo/Idh/MocA family oxidoreductase [Coxiellaceae bacterium]